MAVAETASINNVLDGHVVLDLQCLDRIYLNGYVPQLQVGGQVVTFLTEHLGNHIPSPALFKQIGDRFRDAVRIFAESNNIPVLQLNTPDRSRWDDRKVDHVRDYIDAATQPGVVVIVVAQEVQKVFMGYTRKCKTDSPQFGFQKADRRVTVYYFYFLDPSFGLGFIKICSYFPYPLKMWVNGHEWAKRQATAEGLAFTELANGFATCQDPARLQAICDRLSPSKLQAVFNSWIARIPCPFTRVDRLAGYWWHLSMRQIEVSRTLVLDAPRQARAFFEAVVADNIGVGRPAVVSMLFARRIQRNTPGKFSTRVFTTGTEVRIDFFYKHCRVKLYLKEGRALRIETVVNDADDLDILKGLPHLPQVQRAARQINTRVLTMLRVGQSCAIETALLERISQPYVRDGQRTGALRFGDSRVMALTGALCLTVHAVAGFNNRSLCALVAGLLGTTYTSAQMTYDLRRLRLHGLIARIPRSNTYYLTPQGLRVALFYTKVHHRLLTPLLAADK
ncbi:MAG: hypothetical protein JOZ87_03630, partial [Chloroflexi bacterium]|nr:hypothetical protein [Chloroflexota bacterium]